MLILEIGLKGQLKLKEAKILVIGAGGIGSSLLMYLAGMGVGNIGIVDDDVVERSNLHRQVIHGIKGVKKSKAESAREFIANLNPAVFIRTFNERICASNCFQIVGDYDLVVDGSDNAATRYLVNDVCVSLNVQSLENVSVGISG